MATGVPDYAVAPIICYDGCDLKGTLSNMGGGSESHANDAHQRVPKSKVDSSIRMLSYILVKPVILIYLFLFHARGIARFAAQERTRPRLSPCRGLLEAF